MTPEIVAQIKIKQIQQTLEKLRRQVDELAAVQQSPPNRVVIDRRGL